MLNVNASVADASAVRCNYNDKEAQLIEYEARTLVAAAWCIHLAIANLVMTLLKLLYSLLNHLQNCKTANPGHAHDLLVIPSLLFW